MDNKKKAVKKRGSKSKKARKNVFYKIFIPLFAVMMLFFVGVGYVMANSGAPVFKDKEKESATGESVKKEQEENKEEGKEANDKILANIFINSVDVSKLTKVEALNKLKEKVGNTQEDKTVTFVYGDNRYIMPFSKANFGYDLQNSVDLAFKIGREMDEVQRKESRDKLKLNKNDIQAKRTYEKALVEDFIDKFSLEIAKPAILPTAARDNGLFVYTDGENGLKVDKETVLNAAIEVLNSEASGEVPIVMVEVLPDYNVNDFKKSVDVLGVFKSSLKGSSANREQNVRNAAQKINNVVLMPGEVFSTNNAFGAMTYENGYREGGQIVNGELVDSIGGGVCQVSSTLYMAALNSELKIVERRNHSMKVGYMDWGFDATLAGDYIDLKIKNTTDSPIIFESVLKGTEVVVKIFGNEKRSDTRKVEFVSELVETTEPTDPEIKEDATLPKGEKIVEVKPRTGYKYILYKKVYEGEKLIDKVAVNTSVYKMIPGRVRVGMGVTEEQAKEEIEEVFTNNTPSSGSQIESNTSNVPVEESPVFDPPVPEVAENTGQDGFIVQ